MTRKVHVPVDRALPVSGPVRPVHLSPVDLLSVGLIGIRTRRLRAALSALGIAIGIATMVARFEWTTDLDDCLCEPA